MSVTRVEQPWVGLEYVTVEFASLVFDVPARTIRTWVQRGQVESVRDYEGRIYVHEDKLRARVEKWLRKRRV